MAETKTQDALTLLKEDHRAVEKLFKEFEAAKGDGRKQKLAHQICLDLSVHAELEEALFYIRVFGIGSGVLTSKAKLEQQLSEIRAAAGKPTFPALMEQVNAGLR